MKMLRASKLIVLLAVGILGSASTVYAADKSPADAVKAFNDAINSRNVDAMIAELAKGGVQLSLRPVHPGMPADMPLSSDIQGTWRTVGAVLFATTQSYQRSVTITDSIENGDLATLWADATTTTVRKAGDEPMVLNFSELYLLVKKEGRWQIAAYADNRQPDNIAINGDDAE
jgi:hypothetical protein